MNELTDERIKVIADELAAGNWACFPAESGEVLEMSRELLALRKRVGQLTDQIEVLRHLHLGMLSLYNSQSALLEKVTGKPLQRTFIEYLAKLPCGKLEPIDTDVTNVPPEATNS